MKCIVPFRASGVLPLLVAALTPLLFALFGHVPNLLAATYYAGPGTSTTTWNNTALWWSNTSYTGSQPTSVDTSHNWVLTTGGILRSVSGTFGGGSVSMNDGMLLLKGNTSSVLPSLTASGGMVTDDAGARGITITSFHASAGTTTLRAIHSGNQRTIGTLTGGGNLFLEAGNTASSVLGLTINSAANYTGTMTIISGPGTVDFNSALTSGGPLVVDAGGQLLLDEHVTFSSLSIAGNTLPPGNYTSSYLTANYPANFSGSGGSITVAQMASGIEYFNETFELPENHLSTDWIWSQTGGSGSASYSTDAHGGSRAARVARSGSGTWTFRHDLDLPVPSGENLHSAIPAMPGQNFHLSWWAKSTASATVTFQVVALNNSTVVSNNILPTAKTISGTQGWTELTSTFTIPTGANGFYFRATGSGTTDVVLDDITLVRLDRPLVSGWATQRVEENLARSVVAYRNGSQVYVGWRFLGGDDPDVGFNVFRQAPGGSPVKLNSTPITSSTNYLDATPPTPTAPPAPPAGSYYIEAEDYDSIEGPISVVADAGASGGAYLEADPPGGSSETAPTTGIATYNLNNIPSGTYKIWGRVSVHPSQNSFWVRVNDNPWRRWVGIPGGADWHWDDVHHASSGVVTFELAAGNHTIQIGRGAQGTLLDKLFVTRLGDTPTDAVAPYNVSYRVDTVLGGSTIAQSAPFSVDLRAPAKNYVSFPVPGTVGKVGIGDLDGDGIYDYVVQTPDGSIDPYPSYWQASGSTYKLHGIKSDGTHLWTFDRGWSIERGVWYAPFVVYDFDGDGKAEVAVKAGEGDPRDSNGRVQTGPEYVTIINGLTGNPMPNGSADWPDRTDINSYNHFSRNQIGVAFLDGKTPCLLAARGTYDDMKLHAFQYKNGQLTTLWKWSSRAEGNQFSRYHFQGAHSLHAADVDGDGRDEVVLGSCVIDDNGQGLWSNALKHPDHAYVGELNPANPGMEIYYGYETGRSQNGVSMWDAATGTLLWGVNNTTHHIHREGMCADSDWANPGVEMRSGEQNYATRYFHSATGGVLSEKGMFTNDQLRYATVHWGNTPYKHVMVDSVLAGFPNQPVSVTKFYPFSAATLASDWQWSTDGSLTASYLSDGFVRLDTTGRGNWYFEHKGVPVVANEKYYVTMKVQNLGAGMMNMRVQGLSGSTVVYQNLLATPATLSPDSPWDTLVGSFTVPSGVNQIRMGVNGRMKAHIDDVYLVKDPNAGRLLGTVTSTRGRDAVGWADVMGDWREEIITCVSAGGAQELRIYGTTIPATSRRPSLMEDPKYRTDVAHQAMGYGQSPTASYLLSDSSSTPVEHMFEGEDIASFVATDTTGVLNDGGASNGQALQLNSNAVNDYITFTLPVQAPGTYTVKVGYKRHNSRGRAQLTIDGSNQGSVLDQYGGTTWTETSLGTRNFSTAGNKEFTFTVTGKHASSYSYVLSFDYIKLTP